MSSDAHPRCRVKIEISHIFVSPKGFFFNLIKKAHTHTHTPGLRSRRGRGWVLLNGLYTDLPMCGPHTNGVPELVEPRHGGQMPK